MLPGIRAIRGVMAGLVPAIATCISANADGPDTPAMTDQARTVRILRRRWRGTRGLPTHCRTNLPYGA
jgi:hypothetical protein